MVPDGFSVMILYLRSSRQGWRSCPLSIPPVPSTSILLLHHFLVSPWPLEGPEGEAASGSVVEGHSDAPQVYCGAILLLVVLPQDCTLIHVRMLQGDIGVSEFRILFVVHGLTVSVTTAFFVLPQFSFLIWDQ